MVAYENARGEFLKVPYESVESLGKGTPDQEAGIRAQLAKYLKGTFGVDLDPKNKNLGQHTKDLSGTYYLSMFKDTMQDYIAKIIKQPGGVNVLTQVVDELAKGYNVNGDIDPKLKDDYKNLSKDFTDALTGKLDESRAKTVISEFVEGLFDKKGKTSDLHQKYLNGNDELKQMIVDIYTKERNSDGAANAIYKSVISASINDLINQNRTEFGAYNADALMKILNSNQKSSYDKVVDVSQTTASVEQHLSQMAKQGNKMIGLEDVINEMM